MTQMQELPAGSPTFGHEFNYAVWGANTTVTLANVPWNNDYRDTVKFTNRAGLDTYLDTLAGPTTVTTGMTYAAMGRPIRLDIPFQRANTYNYLRAYNPAQPISGGDTGRAFYYFVTGVNYVAPNTTELIIQLDVWQTFIYDASFGNCFIERGHIGIANENQFADYGREYLTVPEGLDAGGEYQIIDQWSRTIASARGKVPGDAGAYDIMVLSTVALDADPGTPDAPRLASATGSQLENLPNGAEAYLFQSLASFTAFLEAFAEKPWVTQGIISIMAVPNASEYAMNSTAQTIAGITILKINPGSLTNKKTEMGHAWRDTIVLGDAGRYQGLKKFLVSPYTMLEMTSYTGTPILIKPESWADAHATVVEVPHFAQPGPRLLFYPYRYNAANPGPDPVTDAYGVFNDGGEFYDMATGIFNFPTFSIVNNSYVSFMASNVNSINYQHQSADWSQQRALAGNEVTASQATTGIASSQNANRMTVNARNASTAIDNTMAGYQALQSGAGSALSGGITGMKGGPGGAVAGAGMGMVNAGMNYALTTGRNNAQLGVANSLSTGMTANQNDLSGYVRDTNKDYADFAAKGDYQNAVAGINAKVQDAKLLQPTTAGQVGGDAFNLATYKWGYDIKVKMLQSAAMVFHGEYWLRYGYAVNRWGRMPASFMVCDAFTYWKLKETYITSAACPETFKQALRGIFEKGVTVWKNPADIGNIDMANNAPLEGIQL